jgi:hypothetical protein
MGVVMANNVFSFPTFGKAITLDDQGVYYAMNVNTGAIHSIFQLVYEDDWYLFQLQKTRYEGEVCRVLMTDNTDYSLSSMTTEQIRQHFSKPQYAEPKGAWQVIRNSKFGFGKFTPAKPTEPLRYAMLTFIDNEMQMPILVYKAEETVIRLEQAAAHTEVEVA